MDNLQEGINSILGNPQLMQQIMSMAQSLGQSQPEPPPQPVPTGPELDPAMISRVMQLAGQTNIDRNQQALLKALAPYLTGHRISRLEKAMRAAKLAGVASQFLGGKAGMQLV